MTGSVGTVIVAGGQGTLRPGISKLVEPVDILHETPMINQVVETACAAGTHALVLVVSERFRGQILDALQPYGLLSGLDVIEQSERHGAAAAVALAIPSLKQYGCGAFLVVYADMPLWRSETMAGLIELHERANPTLSLVTVSRKGPRVPSALSRYGRIVRDEDGKILRVVEPGDGCPEEIRSIEGVNPSLYVFNTAWFEDHFPAVVPYPRSDGYGDEYYLPPFVEIASRDGRRIAEYPLPDPTEALGVNTPQELEEVRRLMHER